MGAEADTAHPLDGALRTGRALRVVLQVVQGRGQPHAWTVSAGSEAEARALAAAEGLTVLGGRSPVMTWTESASLRIGRVAAAKTEVSVFAQQLHDLLVAGLSVIEALETLARHAASGPQQAMHGALVRRLRDGLRLSEAMREQPDVFPVLLVALVQASELTSDLPQALARYLAHQRQAAELRHRITSVAIYPALVTLVGGLVLLFLAFYVMPRFARIFDGMQGDLPWSARAMVMWSHGVAAHGIWLLGLLVGLALAVGVAWGAGHLRGWVLQALMNWAPVRRYLRTYFLSQWYRAQGMLLEGGIPLPEALDLANGVLPQAMRAGGVAACAAVREGASPADALQRGGMATPVAEQLMRAGERTGDLGAVLNRTAAFHEAELSRELERTMRLLEPVVMTLVGLGVGIVVVLMYLPIFELASALQ